jgi:hypothetical protein
MADEVKSLSDDEYNRMMYGSHGHAAITNAMSQDTQQQVRDPGIVQANPAIPPRAVPQKTNGSPNAPLNRIINSVPQEPDAKAVADQVTQMRNNLRISTPPPVAPSAVHQLADEVTSNWKIPVAVATTMAGVKAAEWGIKKGMSALENRRIAKEQVPVIDRTVDIPMEKVPSAFTSKLAAESEAKFGAPLADVENHFNIKITNLKDAEILTNSYKNSLSGKVSNYPAGIPSGTDPMNAFNTQTSTIKPVVPQTPDVQARNQAAEFRARQLNPVIPPTTPPPSTPPTPVLNKTSAKSAIETELRPGHEFRPGFSTSDTYLLDGLGPEKYKIARMELNEGKPFGKYDVQLVKDVMNKYRVGEKVTAAAAKAAGAGAMSSPGGVPSKSIQRNLKIGGVLGMGLPAWLASRAAELPGYEEAMTRANEAVPGMGSSANAMPFSRGEEMSKMGNAYVTAGNPNYRAELQQQIANEQDPKRLDQLIRELQKTGTVGAGRGIAPPSSYKR